MPSLGIEMGSRGGGVANLELLFVLLPNFRCGITQPWSTAGSGSIASSIFLFHIWGGEGGEDRILGLHGRSRAHRKQAQRHLKELKGSGKVLRPFCACGSVFSPLVVVVLFSF